MEIALASSNKVIMLENSIYSVISQRDASILWRDRQISSSSRGDETNCKRFIKIKIIDEIIPEPLAVLTEIQIVLQQILNIR